MIRPMIGLPVGVFGSVQADSIDVSSISADTAAIAALTADSVTADDVTVDDLLQILRERKDGVTLPSPLPRFPLTSQETIDLLALTPTEIYVPRGLVMKGLLGVSDLVYGVPAVANAAFGPPINPLAFGTRKSVIVTDAAATARWAASSNAIFNIASKTATENMFVLAHIASTSAHANYSVASKAQAAGGPLWDFGITAAGQTQIYINDSVNFVQRVSAGLNLRDGHEHMVGWLLDWQNVGAECKAATDHGNTASGSIGTVGAVTNTGTFSLGGSPAGVASFAFACDWMAVFRGAQLNNLNIKSKIAALGFTVTGV